MRMGRPHAVRMNVPMLGARVKDVLRVTCTFAIAQCNVQVTRSACHRASSNSRMWLRKIVPQVEGSPFEGNPSKKQKAEEDTSFAIRPCHLSKVCIPANAGTHPVVHTHPHTCVTTDTHTCARRHSHTPTHRIHTHTDMDAYVRTDMHAYVRMYVCMHVCTRSLMISY
jgi:hypothetical protein